MQEKYIVYFISKIKKRMSKFIEFQLHQKGIEDLVPSYGNIMTVLYDHEGSLSMKEISDLLGKEKSTITSLVKKLEALGYVKKVKSSQDKRLTYVQLTDKGTGVEGVFDEISRAVHDQAYKDFSPEEKKELLRLLKKLNHNFK